MKKLYPLVLSVFMLMTSAAIAQTWEQLPYYYPRYKSAKIFTSDNDLLIAGVAYSHQPVSVSTDGGTTWQQVFSDKSVGSVEFAPDGTIYLATTKRYMTTSSYYSDTLFKSLNGTAWTNMGYKLKSGYDEGDLYITGNSTLLFPYHSNMNGPVLSKSVDNGISWAELGTNAPSSVAASTTADTIVTGSTSGVYYSHDGGATFTAATGGNWGNSEVGGMEWLPNGDIYAAGPGQFYKSTDGGITFTNLSPNPWMALNVQEFLYAPNGKFYFRGTYGIFESTDCIAWTSLSTTLPSTSIMDIAVSKNYIYAVADSNLYRTPVTSVSTGMNAAEGNERVSIYPNPSKGQFTISSTGTIDRVSVTNIIGQVITSFSPAQNARGEAMISYPFEKPGVYLVQITTDKGSTTTKRLVIE